MGTAAFVVSLMLVAVFLMAALPKALDPVTFGQGVAKYRVLPRGMSMVLGMVLPYGELVLAGWLMSGYALREAGLASLCLFAMFAAASVQAILRRINLECSCIGLLYSERVGWSTVTRDSVLIAVSILVVVLAPRQADSLAADPLRLVTAVAVAATAASIGFINRGQVR